MDGAKVDLVTVDMPIATVPFDKRRKADDVVSTEFGARHCGSALVGMFCHRRPALPPHTPSPVRAVVGKGVVGMPSFMRVGANHR